MRIFPGSAHVLATTSEVEAAQQKEIDEQFKCCCNNNLFVLHLTVSNVEI